jgi:hypothetical protein
MHFYSLELPPIVSEEDVHNHRYGFYSNILKGEMKQEFFQITEGNTHVLEQETCKAGVTSETKPVPCGLKRTAIHWHVKGGIYYISHEVFHRVTTNNCITLLNREKIEKDLAEVVRPIGAQKVCPFSHKIPEETLWGIVEKMLHE